MAQSKEVAYEQAASMVRIQGLMSIIFGAIGTLIGLILMVIFAAALANARYDSEAIEFAIYFIGSLLFVLLPHIYLIISGTILIRRPEPKLSRILTITNLVVGALSNYVVLAFAIISLTQAKDYEEGFKK